MSNPKDEPIYDAAGSPVGSRPNVEADNIPVNEWTAKHVPYLLRLDQEAIELLEAEETYSLIGLQKFYNKIHQLYISQIEGKV